MLFQSGLASTTFYFKVGQALFQSGAGAVLSKWVNVYFKVGQLFQSGAKVISKWGSYFKVGQNVISKWDITILCMGTWQKTLLPNLNTVARVFIIIFVTVIIVSERNTNPSVR